jgi:hypothetical protein
MARDNNTFAKRQREMLKRQKNQDKRARREKRKLQDSGNGIGRKDPATSGEPPNASADADT